MHWGCPSSQQGLMREKKEDLAFTSPGDSRTVSEGRESCRIGSGEQILAAGARLGQGSWWHRPLTRHCYTGHTHVILFFHMHIIFLFKASVFYSQNGNTMVNAKAWVHGAHKFRIAVSILGVWSSWHRNHLAQACRKAQTNLQIHASKFPWRKYALPRSQLFYFAFLSNSPHMAVTLSSSLRSVCCHMPFKRQIFWAICDSVSLLFSTAN